MQETRNVCGAPDTQVFGRVSEVSSRRRVRPSLHSLISSSFPFSLPPFPLSRRAEERGDADGRFSRLIANTHNDAAILDKIISPPSLPPCRRRLLLPPADPPDSLIAKSLLSAAGAAAGGGKGIDSVPSHVRPSVWPNDRLRLQPPLAISFLALPPSAVRTQQCSHSLAQFDVAVEAAGGRKAKTAEGVGAWRRLLGGTGGWFV